MTLPDSSQTTRLRPLVSVLTPSFNQARWLRHNIASVAGQTYDHIEHIVMDGGSTDDTVDVLHTAPSIVRWSSGPDRGQSHALNKAFAASAGEIIGWLNSDDAYFQPQVVEQVVSAFNVNPDVDVIYGHAVLVNADGVIQQVLWAPPFSSRILRFYNFIVQPTVFIRRSALSTTFVDEDYDFSMDRELWMRLAARHKFMRLNGILAVDRHQKLRKSYTRPDLFRQDTVRLQRRYGIAAGPIAATVRKTIKILLRLRGVALVPSIRPPFIFGGRRDPDFAFAMRQVALPRFLMPTDSSPSRRDP